MYLLRKDLPNYLIAWSKRHSWKLTKNTFTYDHHWIPMHFPFPCISLIGQMLSIRFLLPNVLSNTTPRKVLKERVENGQKGGNSHSHTPTTNQPTQLANLNTRKHRKSIRDDSKSIWLDCFWALLYGNGTNSIFLVLISVTKFTSALLYHSNYFSVKTWHQNLDRNLIFLSKTTL